MGGILGPLCGGVSPIMDATAADCQQAADQQARDIMHNAIAQGDKALSQALPSFDWAGVFATGWGIRSLAKIGIVSPGAIVKGAGLGALAKAAWFTGKAAIIEFSGDIHAMWVEGHNNCPDGWSGGLQQ
jgi:hypothetical protein